jgi:hypothetical protein
LLEGNGSWAAVTGCGDAKQPIRGATLLADPVPLAVPPQNGPGFSCLAVPPPDRNPPDLVTAKRFVPVSEL